MKGKTNILVTLSLAQEEENEGNHDLKYSFIVSEFHNHKNWNKFGQNDEAPEMRLVPGEVTLGLNSVG